MSEIGGALHTPIFGALYFIIHRGVYVLVFIENVMAPVRYHENSDQFKQRQDRLNKMLAFRGLELGDDGKLRETKKAKS